MIKEKWYLLYGGTSPDGMGDGEYEGRTTDPAVALKHYQKIKSNPYSTGKVLVITDDKEKLAWDENDINGGT